MTATARTIALTLILPLSALAADCGDVEWFVKPNGAALTRPAYTLKDGALVKSASRAWVGTQCDLTKPTKPSGRDIWASFDSTGTVALCSKR